MLILCPTSTQHTDPGVWDWVRSDDGQSVAEQGQSPTMALRAAGECVLLLPPKAVRWHHITLPSHPASKRAAVVRSVLEDALLQDTDDIHFALLDSPVAGQGQWCAVVSRMALKAWLGALQSVGIVPARIVPMLRPEPALLAWVWPHGAAWQISICDAHGVSHWGPEQSVWPQDLLEATDLSEWRVCCPSNRAQNIETQWPTIRPQVRSTAAWLLERSESPWDLAQGEFKVNSAQRYTQAIARAFTQFRYAPAWRMSRWGLLVAMVGACVLPPTAAWQAQQELKALRLQAQNVVTTTFPEITLVIDPVRQMQRSVNQLALKKGAAISPSIASALGALGQVDGALVTRISSVDGQRWQLQIQGPGKPESIQRALRAAGWQGLHKGGQSWDVQAISGGARS